MPINALSVSVQPKIGAPSPVDVAGCCAEIDRMLASPWTHDEAQGGQGRSYDVTRLPVSARREIRELYMAEHWRVCAEPGPLTVPMRDRDRVYFRFLLPARGGEGTR